MYNYYCKNCNNLVGEWNNKYKYYEHLCDYVYPKNNKLIVFLDCEKCNKFVGIICSYVCEICFGEDEIFGEENLFNWFLKYKKIKSLILKNCKICDNYKFRHQIWFFEELTFYKQ